jgi:hypothetical protein
MMWRNDDGNYWNRTEKVHAYELTFSYVRYDKRSEKNLRDNARCIVIADTIEQAINACRKAWPAEFVLHQAVKRNQGHHLIIVDSVLKNADE